MVWLSTRIIQHKEKRAMNFITKASGSDLQDVDLSPLEFPTETQSIYTKIQSPITDGLSVHREIDPEKAQAIVRTDTHEVLGIHGGRYVHRPYMNNAGRMIEVLKESDLDTTEVKSKIRVYEDGRKLKVELLFPKHLIEPAVGDISQLRLRMYDSYDGSYSSQYFLDAFRLWCSNGCADIQKWLRSTRKHTKQISDNEIFDQAIEKINRAMVAFHEREAEFRKWISLPAYKVDVEHLFSKTIALTSENKVSEPQLEALMNLYNEEDRNVWGVYNAMTNWSSHPDTRGQKHNVIRTRENKVSKTLTSKPWLEMSKADSDLMEVA